MDSKNCAQNSGKKILIIFVLIGLKKGNKEDIVDVLKTKTRI